MLLEIAELGFSAVELGHGVKLGLVEGIRRYRTRPDALPIHSVHNFCPLPFEVRAANPDCYEFTSHRSAERDRAVRLTRKTIEFASDLGASFVVLHLGRIPMASPSKKLLKLIQQGGLLSRAFVKLKIAAVRSRQAKSAFYLDRVCSILEALLPDAEKAGIRLGIETRQNFHELPTEDEAELILNRFDGGPIGYWHDIGHAEFRHNLFFSDHATILRRFAPRILGCHTHDVVWPENDHQPPFHGRIDFDSLIPLIPDSTLFVFEIAPRRNREKIRESRVAWECRFPQHGIPRAFGD